MGQEKAGRRRSGRPNAGQAALSRERILAAALRLVDGDGIEALSMRRLAADLGVNPMSLYHYLPGKDAVIAGLVERVFAEMRPPSAGPAWQSGVRAWALAYSELVRSHPNLVLRIVSDAATASDAMLRISEPLYEALETAGLSPRAIAVAAGAVVDYIHGAALGMDGGPAEQHRVERDLLARVLAQPPGSAPVMRRVFEALVEREDDTEPIWAFERGLDVVISGVEAIAADADHTAS